MQGRGSNKKSQSQQDKHVKFNLENSSDEGLEFNSVELESNSQMSDLVVNMTQIPSGISLLTRKSIIMFKGLHEKQRLLALFDSGATHSLNRLEALSTQLQNEIETFLLNGVDVRKRGFKKCPVQIKGVTSYVNEDCVLAPVYFNWKMGNYT